MSGRESDRTTITPPTPRIVETAPADAARRSLRRPNLRECESDTAVRKPHNASGPQRIA